MAARHIAVKPVVAGVMVATLVVLAACGTTADSDTPAASEWSQRHGSSSASTTTGRPSTTPTTVTPTTPPVPATTTSTALETSARVPEGGRTVAVVAVVDGDTIKVTGGERIRLIGIDTPETKDPRRPVGCFGAEASAHTAALLPPGTTVRLVGDVEPTDRFDRTLSYVVRAEDNLFVNLALVSDGFAVVATYPPNVAHVDDLLAAQVEARTAGRGLWSACPADDDPVVPAPPAVAPTPVDPSVTAPTGAPTGAGCHPSYPTLCLPPTPDIDCGDLTERRFPVLPPDPHRLDGDANGVGCES